MPTKIRLQRFGKKGQPFYRIVVADSRAPRDGRFIENIGIYNPLTIPATIQLDAERALYWLQVGAQPTETARAILSYKGIMYKHHLQKGVVKGALTQEVADVKFNEWIEKKEEKITQRIKDRELDQKEKMKKKIQEESKVREEIAKSVAEKRAKEAASKVTSTEESIPEPEVAPATENEVITEEVSETVVPEQPEVPETLVTEQPEEPVNGEDAAVADTAPELSEEQPE